MAFDWLTFGFEIVNFLVLVWLLHRLLYRPVLAMIQRRRDEIAASTQAAKALRAEAEQLKAEYDRRLEDWAGERARARRELDEELERERQRRLQALETELAERRQREAALREALRTASAPLQATSAHPLDDTQRAELARALAALAGDGTPAIDYREDPALLAGLRLQVGAWQLGANLQDELQAFTELVPADG